MFRRLRLILLTLLVALVGSALPVRAQAAVQAAGRPVHFDVLPVTVDGVLMVPVRSVAETLGGSVTWNGRSRTATIQTEETVVELTAGADYAVINGHVVPLSGRSQIIGDRLLVPASFLLTFYGDALSIDHPGLIQPEAMALLEHAGKAALADIDFTFSQNATITVLGPGAQRFGLEMVQSAQIRGQEMTSTMHVTGPAGLMMPPLRMAARNGQTYLNDGTGWQIAPQAAGAAQLEALLNSQALTQFYREARLGTWRYEGGRKLQEVVLSLDTKVLNRMTESMLTTMIPAGHGIEFKMNWQAAIARMTFDLESGRLVSQEIQAAVMVAVHEGGQSLRFRMELNQVLTLTPGLEPISWPAELQGE